MTGFPSPGDPALAGLLVALGIGLLIGLERERRKRERPAQAGIRTFALVALSGAVATLIGGEVALAVVTAAVGAVTAAGVWASRPGDDPGLTTEIALVLTTLLGGLAMREASLAAMIGAAVAILLAARSPIHRFVGTVLTEREVADGLVIAGASLVVLPLLPDRNLGPFEALNPREIWLLVILVLGVGAVGHAAVRLVGARFGLPLAGFLGGFVSSAATIAAMGARARATPAEARAGAAAAVLSTIATFIQLALVLGAVSPATLASAAPSLLAGGAVALVFGVSTTLRALSAQTAAALPDDGRGAFSLGSAITFATTVCAVLILAAGARVGFGVAGISLAAVLAGLVDAHAAAISVANLAAAGRITADAALVPVLLGLTANAATKIALAGANGDRTFLLRVGPGLLMVVAAVWTPLIVRAAT